MPYRVFLGFLYNRCVPKLPDYEERSAALAQDCLELDQRMIEEVSGIIRSGLKESAQLLINLLKFEGKDAVDVQSAKVRFDAAKHSLKLGGLEVEKSEVKNSGAMSLTISPEQAARVIDAANK